MAKQPLFTTFACIGCCFFILAIVLFAVLGFSFAMITRSSQKVHTYCLFMTNRFVAPLPASGGDTDGFGFGFITLDTMASSVTYQIETVNIAPDTPIALEIRGPATTVVGNVTIGGLDPTLDSNNIMSGTKEIGVETIVSDIAASPYLYYVVIRTSGHTSGSIADRLGYNECRLTN